MVITRLKTVVTDITAIPFAEAFSSPGASDGEVISPEADGPIVEPDGAPPEGPIAEPDGASPEGPIAEPDGASPEGPIGEYADGESDGEYADGESDGEYADGESDGE